MAKGWLDNYGKQENYNDSKTSAPEGYEGEGYSMKGRNYSPAWGGQFQTGGYLKKKISKKEKDLLEKYVDPLTQRANERAIEQGITEGIHNGPLDAIRHSSSAAAMSSILPSWANFIPGVAPLNILATNIAGAAHEFNSPNTLKEHASDVYNNFIGSVVGALPISEKNQHDLLIQAQKNNVLSNLGDKTPLLKKPEVDLQQKIQKLFKLPPLQMGGSVYPVNYVPQAQMGASIPGAVGFSYARVGAPSKGPRRNQTDVTDASAQNGKEMKYYQEGLDFKPKSISKNGGWLNKYDVAQAGAQVEYGTPEYEESYNKGEVVTDEGGRSPILLDEVVVEGKPLTEFGKTRKEIAEKNKWEDFAQRYLGYFGKGWMGESPETLGPHRRKEYEDYINKLTFDEYIKTHPQAKGEDRGAYIDRMQAENANSSNFERAYEANADYNDATDVNKWRKSLVGLGSLVVPKLAMDYLKQNSDYYSKKEKQAMIDNPISTKVGDVLGTLDPLSIPVEGLYGEKSFGDIASGESADIPMSMRILGDPLMPLFEAAPLLGAGFKTAGRLLGTEEGLLSNTWKLNPRAYQYNLPENTMWRGLGKQGMEDAVSSGLFRSKQNVASEFFPGSTLRMNKSFGTNPYFTPKFKTASTYGDNFLAEVPRDAANWRNRYARTDWSQVADKPISINEGRLLQKDWLQGYKPIEVPIATESVAPKPWSMQELPGLHLQSTMDNGAILKILEPKSGLINTEQALAIIGKESGGSDKVALIKQALGENIPKKIDYNEFRKVVQNQLIPLETNFTEHASNYGLGKIGYPSPKRSTYEAAINNTNQDIQNLTNKINELKSNPANASMLPEYQTRLDEAYAQLAKNQEGLNSLPLENKTLLFSNEGKFGRGSHAHNNPDNTLGHAHYLVDAETPDILTVTQIQSDAFQGSNRIMPKDLESAQRSLSRMMEHEEALKNTYFNARAAPEKGLDIYGEPRWYELPDGTVVSQEQMQIGASSQTRLNQLSKAEIENYSQKVLLDKNHQERYLQEIVNHAAERGNINKVRVPTPETAAKVQRYQKKYNTDLMDNKYAEQLVNWRNQGKSPKQALDEAEKMYGKASSDEVKQFYNQYNTLSAKYSLEHQTILKKYSELPKTIKKLFGQDAKIVTDSKGNTWYEFDIPKSFKEGKGEIKAFKQGGVIESNRGQWDHPGKVTRIKGGNITMKRDPKTGKALTQPILGIANTGERQWMYPGQDYQFQNAEYVTEYPKGKLAKNGNELVKLDQLTNFTNYNKPQPGGWLNKYN